MISFQAEFAKVKPEMVASMLEPALWAELRELYPMIANKHKPDLWNRLPVALQVLTLLRILLLKPICCTAPTNLPESSVERS